MKINFVSFGTLSAFLLVISVLSGKSVFQNFLWILPYYAIMFQHNIIKYITGKISKSNLDLKVSAYGEYTHTPSLILSTLPLLMTVLVTIVLTIIPVLVVLYLSLSNPAIIVDLLLGGPVSIFVVNVLYSLYNYLLTQLLPIHNSDSYNILSRYLTESKIKYLDMISLGASLAIIYNYCCAPTQSFVIPTFLVAIFSLFKNLALITLVRGEND